VNVTGLFIRRPVMTALIMLAILAFGLVAYRDLAVSDLPNVDFPTLQISAALPGASPETMAAAVATPLEKQFTTIAGIDSMTSTSSLGATQITLQFDLDRNIDSAALDVQSAIAAAGNQLPPDMPSPPTFKKVNPADTPILYLGLTSATLPLSKVDEYAETLLGQQISMVQGVAQVSVFGSMKYAVRVQLNPQQLAARRIGIDEVADAIRRANVNLPMGTLYGPDTAFNIQSNGQLTSAARYRPMIVAYRNGAPVRLNEVATVSDSVQDNRLAGWINAEPGIILAIQRQPGTNTIAIVDAIRNLLPRFRSIMPPAMHLSIEYDRSISIRDSVSDVKFTLFLAVLLVVLVIFLFLRNLSATLIPSLAVPMAIIGTFAVMYQLNYTIDNLSLLALTLSVGFVVDDAIVMLENIVRHMEQGKGVRHAAFEGSREIGFTIFSMTISLAAVFLPVFFMGGIIGRLLHEFSVVIVSAVLVSGVVSLTLTPMLCSRYLRAQHAQKRGWLYRAMESALDGALNRYAVTLRWALRHRLVVMACGAAILAGTAWEFWTIPKGFLPEEDTSQVAVFSEARQGISFDAMKARQEALNQIILDDPNTLQFFSRIAANNTTGLNNGRASVHLKELPERAWTTNPAYDRLVAKHGGTPVLGAMVRAARPLFEHHMTIPDIMAELKPKLDAIPGFRVFLQNPPSIRIGGQITKSQYQFTLVSPQTDDLYRNAQSFAAQMEQLPSVVNVATDLQVRNPQVNVLVDRDQAAALGVTPQAVQDALYSAYGQRQVSTIYTPNDEYFVILQLEDRYQRDPRMLSQLYIRSSTGQLVPLSAVSRFDTGFGPLTVNHTGQLPSVTLSFDLARGAALGQAVSEVQQLADANLPISVMTSFQGSAQAFQESFRGLGVLLGMAVLVIYLVLGILYESFIHPITILTGLPAAAFGGLLTLTIFHMQLDLYGFVGLIMLIGIIKKNAIMMVDFALERERSGDCTAAESAYEGSLARFRPIMMTTAAAVMGTLPIAIGFGAGAESRRPLGLCVVGGLAFAQLVTLYLTPVFYTYMDSLLKWNRGRKHPSPVEVEAGFGAD
jgi:HAE1 family hydrophobic/amphiphilic exporter-1